MKLFSCQKCGQLLYFENVRCERCHSPLGFTPDSMDLLTLVSAGDKTFQAYDNQAEVYRYCANAQYDACNWLIPAYDSNNYCTACQLNRTVPDLADKNNLKLWRKLETAKHRLVYTLLKMKLPLTPKPVSTTTGLAFDFLADWIDVKGEIQKVLTGHAQGLVTININEADDAHRAQMRQDMGERYRTLLGHFRHEVGHYYWELLIADSNNLPEYRALFGDERQNYGEALQSHYQQGPPLGWRDSFISSYATAHSWEDWAETWAHYLHMVDTLATAYAFGLQIQPRVTEEEKLIAEIDRDPYRIRRFDRILELWLPLTIAMNSINRSMGQPDMYPFVISDAVAAKLSFIHNIVRASASDD
ncbi:zinc-binding metallopeptidase family protein [Tunicatimonas pelagia]|uniref:zinc-binding metallopeptidase family protein n=1 Tax=Tunicatimonas pelagia TaxID=931531 RepID=UPI00266623AF|nr:putative zinc-binding peptidase [Tunicatimonas pelagia]WKN42443.1 putative zinc-binding peptidase [Tunicatimonas pelagia]